MAINCWEFNKCERQLGGSKVKEFGFCPTSKAETYDGVNNGTNGGRYCWRIAGTLCGGKVQGSYASKVINCLACDFFKLVYKQEKEKLRF